MLVTIEVVEKEVYVVGVVAGNATRKNTAYRRRRMLRAPTHSSLARDMFRRRRLKHFEITRSWLVNAVNIASWYLYRARPPSTHATEVL